MFRAPRRRCTLRSVALVALVALLGVVPRAHAEPTTRARASHGLPAPLLLVRLAEAPLAGDVNREMPPHVVSFDPIATHRRLRRARYLTAIGAGLTVTGVVGMAAFGRRGTCSGYDARHGWLPGAFAAGLTTLTVGVGFTVGGTVTLLGVPRDARQRDRARFPDRAGPVWVGVMTAIVGSMVFTATGIVALVGCNNT